MIDVSEVELKKVLRSIFDRFDKDNDKYLNIREVKDMMRHAHRMKNSKSETDIKKDAREFLF